MADTIRASLHGITELRADLEAVRIGLGRELAQTIKDAVDLYGAAAGPALPYDPEHTAGRKDGLQHIRDSLYAIALGNTGALATRHPGTPVHWWGGTIAPRGHDIKIEQSGARDAAHAQVTVINRLLEQRIDELVQRHFPR